MFSSHRPRALLSGSPSALSCALARCFPLMSRSGSISRSARTFATIVPDASVSGGFRQRPRESSSPPKRRASASLTIAKKRAKNIRRQIETSDPDLHQAICRRLLDLIRGIRRSLASPRSRDLLERRILPLVRQVKIHDLSSFNKLLKTLAPINGASASMLDLINEASNNNTSFAPDITSYSHLLLAYTREPNAKAKALDVLKMVEDRQLTPDLPFLTNLAKAAKAPNLTVVINVMRSHNIEPDDKFWHAVVKTLARAGKIKEALHLLEQSHSDLRPDLTTFNAILVACYAAEDLRTAKFIREVMQAENVAPNIVALSTLILLCARVKQREQSRRNGGDKFLATSEDYRPLVSSCLSDLRQYKIKPAVVFFNALIGCTTSEQAEALLTILTEAGYAPNTATYNQLIHNCATEHDYDHAVKLLHRMKESRVPTDARTFHMIFKLCRNISDPSLALTYAKQQWAAMQQEYGHQPDLLHYRAMILMYGRAGEIDEGLAVIEEASKNGLESYAARFYTSLIDGLFSPRGRPDQNDSLSARFRYDSVIRVIRKAEAEQALPTQMQTLKLAFKQSLKYRLFADSEWLLSCMLQRGLSADDHERLVQMLQAKRSSQL